MRIGLGKNPVLNRSGPSLMNFFETLKKGFWRGLRGWKKSRNWRIWGALLEVDFMIWLGVNQCFAPLPCTVYLVARSALYVRAHSQNWNVRSFVSSESNYFLRRGYEGVTTCLWARVFWTIDFLGFENFWKKKSVQSVHIWCGLLEVKIRFWTSFDQLLANFFETLKKGFWRGLRGWKKLRNWRIWGALLGVDFMIWLGVNQCFAPLPCTVYLVWNFSF